MKSLIRKKMQRFFFYLIWKFLPSCKEFVPLLSESLDRELSLYKKTIVRLHLAACPPCVRYLKQLGFVREASRRSAGRPAPSRSLVKLSSETRERMKDALKNSSAALGIFIGL